jgi:hypothetical protein
MFISRAIVLSLFTAMIAAGPLGCASPSDASDDVASPTSDLSTSAKDPVVAQVGQLLSQEAPSPGPLADNHGAPSLDQVVEVLTDALDLTPIQVKKLRAFLLAQQAAYRHAHH